MRLIAAKTWREVRMMTFVYTLILELQLVLAILLWPTLRDEAASLARMIPADFIKRMVDAISNPSREAAYNAYMAIQMFFKGVNVVGIACAVLLGTGIVARERENLTLEFLLARPVSRSRVLLGKFLVVATAVIVPIFLTSLSAIPVGWIVDERLDAGRVLAASLHSSTFCCLILALTCIVSVLGRTQVHVAFVVGAFLIVEVCIYFIQQVRAASLFRLSDFDVYGPLMMGHLGFGELFLRRTLWLALAGAGLYLLADRTFRRIDL